jgi:hypothetical protein
MWFGSVAEGKGGRRISERCENSNRSKLVGCGELWKKVLLPELELELRE